VPSGQVSTQAPELKYFPVSQEEHEVDKEERQVLQDE
jgi:hypothetical protein